MTQENRDLAVLSIERDMLLVTDAFASNKT